MAQSLFVSLLRLWRFAVAMAEAEPKVEICRRICVTGGGCKSQPWIFQAVENLEGFEFGKLSRRDTGFARFVCGVPKWERHMLWLDDLRAKRTEASIMAADAGAAASLFDPLSNPAARKRRKVEAAEKLARGELPPFVTVKLPSFQGVDGVVVQALEAKVKTDLAVSAVVSMEITASNLEYVRQAMLACQEAEEPKVRAVVNDAVRWRGDRKAWIATREADGKRISKTFKPKDPEDDDEKGRCKDAAKMWALAGSSEEVGAEAEDAASSEMCEAGAQEDEGSVSGEGSAGEEGDDGK